MTESSHQCYWSFIPLKIRQKAFVVGKNWQNRMEFANHLASLTTCEWTSEVMWLLKLTHTSGRNETKKEGSQEWSVEIVETNVKEINLSIGQIELAEIIELPQGGTNQKWIKTKPSGEIWKSKKKKEMGSLSSAPLNLTRVMSGVDCRLLSFSDPWARILGELGRNPSSLEEWSLSSTKSIVTENYYSLTDSLASIHSLTHTHTSVGVGHMHTYRHWTHKHTLVPWARLIEQMDWMGSQTVVKEPAASVQCHAKHLLHPSIACCPVHDRGPSGPSTTSRFLKPPSPTLFYLITVFSPLSSSRIMEVEHSFLDGPSVGRPSTTRFTMSREEKRTQEEEETDKTLRIAPNYCRWCVLTKEVRLLKS